MLCISAVKTELLSSVTFSFCSAVSRVKQLHGFCVRHWVREPKHGIQSRSLVYKMIKSDDEINQVKGDILGENIIFEPTTECCQYLLRGVELEGILNNIICPLHEASLPLGLFENTQQKSLRNQPKEDRTESPDSQTMVAHCSPLHDDRSHLMNITQSCPFDEIEKALQ